MNMITDYLRRRKSTPVLPSLPMGSARRDVLNTNPMPAHTISQRIRTLKKIPPELIPLGVVLFAAIAAAGYSIVRKFYTDRTLRLYRQGPQKDH